MKETTTMKATAERRRPVGHLKIARVTYDDHPLVMGSDLSVGGLIDEHIAKVIQGGGLISEVTLYFETREQQEELAHAYRK